MSDQNEQAVNQQENKVRDVHISPEQAERWPKVDAALHRLYKNEDFKLLTKELFEHEALRMVSGLGDDALRASGITDKMTEDLKAIGIMQAFLRDIHQRGAFARSVNLTPEEVQAIVDRDEAALYASEDE